MKQYITKSQTVSHRPYHKGPFVFSFTEILNAAKTRFNLTDGQTAAILDAAVADS